MIPSVATGARRHLVTLQNPSAAVADGDGGYAVSWFDLSPATAYAAIKPATARDLERVAAGTVIATATHVVSMPFHPGVTTATRIVFGARVFSVTGVSNPDERNIETLCAAVELLNQAPVDLGTVIDGGDPDDVFAGGFDGGGV